MHSNYLLEDIAKLDMFIFAWTDISTLGGFDLVCVCVQARVCVCVHVLTYCIIAFCGAFLLKRLYDSPSLSMDLRQLGSAVSLSASAGSASRLIGSLHPAK